MGSILVSHVKGALRARYTFSQGLPLLPHLSQFFELGFDLHSYWGSTIRCLKQRRQRPTLGQAVLVSLRRRLFGLILPAPLRFLPAAEAEGADWTGVVDISNKSWKI